MGSPYVIYNNIDSRTLGVWVSRLPDIVRPQERVTSVVIYGRPGSLHTSEGINIYDSYEKTVTITVRPEADIREVLNTFKGSGEAIFSNEPERIYDVRIIKPLELKREGTWLLTGDIVFEAQPFKRDAVRPQTKTITSGATVYNAGDVQLYPVLNVTATGATATIVIGDQTLVISGTDGVSKTYTIDCANETCVDSNMNNGNMNLSGNYPYFPVGNSTVTLSGITSFSFLPDWLYL